MLSIRHQNIRHRVVMVQRAFCQWRKEQILFLLMRDHTLARVSCPENLQFPSFVLCIGNLLYYYVS